MPTKQFHFRCLLKLVLNKMFGYFRQRERKQGEKKHSGSTPENYSHMTEAQNMAG